MPFSPQSVQFRQRGSFLEWKGTFRVELFSGAPLLPPCSPVLLCSPLEAAQEVIAKSATRGDTEFRRTAKRFPGPRFESAVIGKQAELTGSVGLEELGLKKGALIALASSDKRGLSPSSPRQWFLPQLPALPPALQLVATPQEQGVALSWTKPDDSRIEGFDLYRAEPSRQFGWSPWRHVAADASQLLDESVQWGEKWVYAIASTASAGGLTAQSNLTLSNPIEYLDRFAPEPPKDLDVVAESAAIRVLWYPGGSSDEAQVRVERETESGERIVVAEIKSPSTMFLDRSVPAAVRVRYRVLAIDRAGNESAPTPFSDWVEPLPGER